MWMWMPRTPDPAPSETGADPQIAHQTSGRLRLRLACWPDLPQDDVERRLRRVEGVLDVRATPLTRGILLRFDPAATTVEHLLVAVRVLALPTASGLAHTRARSISESAQAPVAAVERPHESQAVDDAPLLPASPASTVPALPVYLTPLADVMAWANEAIAQSGPLDTLPAASAQPGAYVPAAPNRPTSYLDRLLGVLRRLDTAALALKALSALAGAACAASPLALFLSLVEIAQLLADLHLRAIA